MMIVSVSYTHLDVYKRQAAYVECKLIRIASCVDSGIVDAYVATIVAYYVLGICVFYCHTVSYTHLDVYKRQVLSFLFLFLRL